MLSLPFKCIRSVDRHAEAGIADTRQGRCIPFIVTRDTYLVPSRFGIYNTTQSHLNTSLCSVNVWTDVWTNGVFTYMHLRAHQAILPKTMDDAHQALHDGKGATMASKAHFNYVLRYDKIESCDYFCFQKHHQHDARTWMGSRKRRPHVWQDYQCV